MSKAAMGARVIFCGHAGYFVADIWRVGNVNVIQANGPVTPSNLIRDDLDTATHQMTDFPLAGFWDTHRGLFVVPEGQVTAIRRGKARGTSPEPLSTEAGRQMVQHKEEKETEDL